MTSDENPFEAPKTDPIPDDAPDDYAAVRRAHLAHETSVKAIGSLYLLSGCLAIASGLAALVDTQVMGMAFIGFGVATALVGNKTRKLDNWARVPASVLSALGLILFPVGTVICSYALYLFWSPKGSMVFSDQYQLVIHETPALRYRTSSVVTVIVAIVLVGLFVGVCGSVLDL